MSRRGRGESRTRHVRYGWESPVGVDWDWSAIDHVIESARDAGVIACSGAGRGIVWFSGRPGRELRDVRDAVRSLVTTTGPARALTWARHVRSR